MKNLTLLLLALALLTQCKKSEQQTFENSVQDEGLLRAIEVDPYLNLPASPTLYESKFPSYLKVLGVIPVPINDAKAALGRVLFYDKNLSKDRSVSCASCHKQEFAFSDNVAVSKGVEGRVGTRNAMALANVAQFGSHYAKTGQNAPHLLWDNRSNNVPNQATQAFTNPNEMDISLEEVMLRVHELPYYKHLFKDVYGNSDMTQDQMLTAIGEFVKAIGSYSSELDQSLQLNVGSDFNTTNLTTAYYSPVIVDPLLTTEESRGRVLFVNNCTSCHSPIREFQKVFEACNGLDMNYVDEGRGAITHAGNHMGLFKSPSLRNIELTAPYMHDGRFKTLEEVIDFYSEGIADHPNLHESLKRPGRHGLGFTPAEKSQLLAFMKTMTDKNLVKDGRFSNPFK